MRPIVRHRSRDNKRHVVINAVIFILSLAVDAKGTRTKRDFPAVPNAHDGNAAQIKSELLANLNRYSVGERHGSAGLLASIADSPTASQERDRNNENDNYYSWLSRKNNNDNNNIDEMEETMRPSTKPYFSSVAKIDQRKTPRVNVMMTDFVERGSIPAVDALHHMDVGGRGTTDVYQRHQIAQTKDGSAANAIAPPINGKPIYVNRTTSATRLTTKFADHAISKMLKLAKYGTPTVDGEEVNGVLLPKPLPTADDHRPIILRKVPSSADGTQGDASAVNNVASRLKLPAWNRNVAEKLYSSNQLVEVKPSPIHNRDYDDNDVAVPILSVRGDGVAPASYIRNQREYARSLTPALTFGSPQPQQPTLFHNFDSFGLLKSMPSLPPPPPPPSSPASRHQFLGHSPRKFLSGANIAPSASFKAPVQLLSEYAPISVTRSPTLSTTTVTAKTFAPEVYARESQALDAEYYDEPHTAMYERHIPSLQYDSERPIQQKTGQRCDNCSQAVKSYEAVQNMRYEENTHMCNSQRLARVIREMAVSGDAEASKRAIQQRAESEFGTFYNVVCGTGFFSYIAHTNEFCLATVGGDLNCYAFAPICSMRLGLTSGVAHQQRRRLRRRLLLREWRNRRLHESVDRRLWKLPAAHRTHADNATHNTIKDENVNATLSISIGEHADNYNNNYNNAGEVV